jgi:hypothetical protein
LSPFYTIESANIENGLTFPIWKSKTSNYGKKNGMQSLKLEKMRSNDVQLEHAS